MKLKNHAYSLVDGLKKIIKSLFSLQCEGDNNEKNVWGKLIKTREVGRTDNDLNVIAFIVVLIS